MERVDLALLVDRCLDALDRGAGVEEALGAAGEHRAEIEPLLRAAVRVRRAATVEPRPEFVTAGQARLLAGIKGQTRPVVTSFTLRRLLGQTKSVDWSRQPRRLSMSGLVAAVALMVSLMGGGGAAYASQDALPGQALYRVKVMMEIARLDLAGSEATQVQLRLAFAQERVDELWQLVDVGSGQAVVAAADSYRANAGAAVAALGNDDEAPAGDSVRQQLRLHQQVLEQVQQRLAERLGQDSEAVKALGDAIENARELQEQVRARQQLRLGTATAVPGSDAGDSAAGSGSDPTATRERQQDRDRDRTHTVTGTSTGAAADAATATATPEPPGDQVQDRDQAQEQDQNRDGDCQADCTPPATDDGGQNQEQNQERTQQQEPPTSTPAPQPQSGGQPEATATRVQAGPPADQGQQATAVPQPTPQQHQGDPTGQAGANAQGSGSGGR